MKKLLEILFCETFGAVIHFLVTEIFLPYQKSSPGYKGVWRLRGESAECRHITKTLKNVGT